MLYYFWILFKLIKSLIVLVSSKLWYASFPYKIAYVLNLKKINCLNLVPTPIFWVPVPIFFTKKHCVDVGACT